MRLLSARVVSVGPFTDLTFRMANEDGAPRAGIVILGGGGTGKSSLLSAIAQTRPGLAMALPNSRRGRAKDTPYAVTEWALGQDDPSRPHSLVVASPNAKLAEDEDASLRRRREQAAFDKLAVDSGFVLVSFSGARWFSRTPLLLTAPDRTILRYDVRAPASFDDATRADLTRETKQALSYSDIAARLEDSLRGASTFSVLRAATSSVVSELTSLAGHRFVGADAATLEPLFETDDGTPVLFDDLPTAAKHLASFGALTVRALFGAKPHLDPRASEGVVLVDDAALHLETRAAHGLLGALRSALPAVQWILTTSSSALAHSADDVLVLALRRMSAAEAVQIYDGPLAMLH